MHLDDSPASLARPDTFHMGQRDVLERIASGAPLSEVLDCLVRLVEQQADGLFGSILTLDQERRHLRVGSAPNLPAEYSSAIDGFEIGPEVGSCGAAAWRGERIIVEDIDTHPYWDAYKQIALPHGLRACWSSPIFSPKLEVLGTFAIYYRQPRGPSPAEIAWVDAATHLASIAITHDAAREALLHSEGRYRLMVDTAYEGIWRVDTGARVNFVNRRMADMLGYEPEEIVGQSMFNFMNEASGKIAEKMLERRWSGISEQYEFVFRRRDGSELWAIVAASPDRDERGRITGSLGMITDITKRKHAEAALLRSEAQFRTIFESAAIGVALVDSEGHIQKTNPAMQQLLGYSAEELEEMTIAQLTHPEDLDLSYFRELGTGRRDSYSYERRYLCKGGRIVWVRVTASAVREVDGRFRFAVGMIEDITQARLAEQERARLEIQLRQSQKMQSLGTLAGGIAHDFNNILTAISGNTQLALADLTPDHPARVSLQEIEQASERAAGLVRQILAFSRPQEPKRKIMKLQTVIEEALRLLRASLPATIGIQTDFDAMTPDIAADATQIHQVVMNLGANAAHAIGDHVGQIEFRLTPITVDAPLAATSPDLHEGRYSRLSVRDDGCGMEATTLERIFEPFFTTKKPGHGTGLGLSVVHGIIKGHGGAVTVNSHPRQGTTFHLYFPAAKATAPESTPTPLESLSGHGERVLYVDDEDHLIFLAQRGLHRFGYEVTVFNDARQALDAFRAQPSEFDLVVTDLAMPGMNGLEFAGEVRGLRSDVPVIITSGYLRPQDIEAAHRLGIHELLPKPTSLDQLARSIQRTLQSR